MYVRPFLICLFKPSTTAFGGGPPSFLIIADAILKKDGLLTVTVRREPRKEMSEIMFQICATLPERHGYASVAANSPLTLSRVGGIFMPP